MPPFFLALTLSLPSYAGALKPYVIFDMQAHSETVPIKDAMEDWEGNSFERGENQWVSAWFETGLRYKRWGMGFVKRYDFDLRFSEDTAELYWLSANKNPLPLGRNFNVRIKAKAIKASGLRVMFSDALGQSAFYSLGLTYLKAHYTVDGGITGFADVINEKDYEFDLLIDYHYTEDTLFDRVVEEPSGKGFAVVAEFNYQFANATQLHVQVRDLFANIYWDESPYTEGLATSNRKEYDENGYVSIKPVLSGFEGIDSQTVQRLEPRWFAQLSHTFAGPYGGLFQYRHQYERHLFGLGATLAVGEGEISTSYWAVQNALEISWHCRRLGFSVTADQLDESDLKSIWLSLSYGR
ncbi:MAG: hypothetical protein JKY01_07390 [Pseudomonadales bacterium]|nr:hypothetical protein [Pseudomonadales bacterium]